MLAGRAGGARAAQGARVSRWSSSPTSPTSRAARQRRAIVEAMHARLAPALPLDEFRVCYHDDADGCECRKPKAGPAAGRGA